MASQCQAFLESTALIDLVFKDKKRRTAVLATIQTCPRRVTSRYVVYEVSRGYVQNLIIAHTRSLQCDTFADLLAYTSRLYMQPNMLGSILTAIADFIRTGNLVDPASSMPQDEQMLLKCRANLSLLIRRWKKIMQQVDEVINDVGCREDLTEPYQDGAGYAQELKRELCGKYSNCGVKDYVAKHKQDFVRIADTLRATPNPDEETKKRIRRLRELYRVQKRDFAKSDCWRSSDAIIVHESPPGTATVTSNKKHFGPITAILGKNLLSYT